MHVRAIRVRLEHAERTRDLALFDAAIDGRLRGCDLVRLTVADVVVARRVEDLLADLHRQARRIGQA